MLGPPQISSVFTVYGGFLRGGSNAVCTVHGRESRDGARLRKSLTIVGVPCFVLHWVVGEPKSSSTVLLSRSMVHRAKYWWLCSLECLSGFSRGSFSLVVLSCSIVRLTWMLSRRFA